MGKNTCYTDRCPELGSLHPHKKLSVYNPSIIEGRDRRIAGICWLPARLQVSEALSEMNALERYRAEHLMSSSFQIPTSKYGLLYPCAPPPMVKGQLWIWRLCL